MHFYTVIMEFQGGTYVSQHLAQDQDAALIKAFKENIADNELPDFTDDLWEEIDFWMEECGTVLLDGSKNVWYFSLLFNDESQHCHIIKTSQD